MIAVAVIVAAGKGERFGDASKVLTPLLDRPVLAWTLDAFEHATSVTEIVLVVGEHTMVPISELLALRSWTKVRQIVLGGDTRQQSTANGVRAAREDAEIVLVHDAARPLVNSDQIDATVSAAAKSGGAILAAQVTDTIKRCIEGQIVETIDRSTLWQAQTPQVFNMKLMAEMIALAQSGDVLMTDEASLAEHLGYPVTIVPSDSTNLKITHPHDVLVAEAILRARKEATS
ncbi:MAG: 2-C-methyl-D-erythritol 4-phosphate cytidylyltransferase [Thermomicrobiales bacterium]|nr:2-C-methyl-D-erythritol 4-phosphate cytidylyltransferase [Thermomicrobiales bacterium]MCO5227024.1 2-C-methyl-D-erythritol 4-phosphate cytidylyltransferase [Thermomicrobiales bacterium]